MAEDRLQKILSHAGAAPSRRKAEKLIEQGRVTVNGRVATLGDSADPEKDHIKLDGKRVELPEFYHYLLLNKPPEVMSTRSDPEGRRTVMDFVPPGLERKVVPVGRLDFHTEGLLILTDDGDFAHRIAHPRHGCTKTYEVKVSGVPEEKELDKLRRGIVLEGRRTAPAEIVRARETRGHRAPTENSWWQVELTEGRTRQIREMFFRIGHSVQRLRRIAIGPLRDPYLNPGEMRELTRKELKMLRDATGGAKPAKKGKGGRVSKRKRGKKGSQRK